MGLTVLSVAYPFAPLTMDSVGGAEQVLSRLDRALVAAGHRSIVIAAPGSSPAGELLALPGLQGPLDEQTRRQIHSRLRKMVLETIQAHRPDIVHMHGLDFHAYLSPISTPVLVTLHMPLSWYPDEALRTERAGLWFNPVSHHQAGSAGEGLHLLPAIENGVDADDQTSPRKGSYALALGRICPEKGFHLALDAAKAAGVPLLLAGQVFPYPDHERYFREEIRPRLDRKRRLLGPIGGARKRRLLRRARCVLAPSLVPETASLVAREALAAGTPVIAFPNGALSEVVEPGRTGFLVDDAAQMAAAIRRAGEIDPAACQRAARERFAARRMVDQYMQLYHQLAGKAL